MPPNAAGLANELSAVKAILLSFMRRVVSASLLIRKINLFCDCTIDKPAMPLCSICMIGVGALSRAGGYMIRLACLF